MKNVDKWIEIFRKNIKASGIDPDQYSDDEVLTIAEGTMAPIICNEQNISNRWIFELYWCALLTMEPNKEVQEAVDMSLFKKRVKDNKN